MKRTEQFHEIIIFDDDQLQEQVPALLKTEKSQKCSKKVKEQNDIFVFDDENSDEPQYDEEIIYQKKQILTLKQNNGKRMSAEEYKDKCAELSNKIIFSNLTNFNKQIKKPQQSYHQDIKRKRQSMLDNKRKQFNIENRIQTLPLPRNKIQDVKCNFAQVSLVKQKTIISECETIIAESLNDELNTETSKNKRQHKDDNETVYEIQGADFQQKKTMKIEEHKEKNILKVSNFRQFLFMELKPTYQIYVKIKRVQDGFFNSKYKFYFQENNKFIMSCQKKMFTKYVFSSSEVHTSEDHISYLGKMEANFLGSQFCIYDGGQDYTETKMMENYKKQIGFIKYTQEKGQPRKFQSLITTCDNKSTNFTVHDKSSLNVLQERWSKKKCQNITRLYSKEPNFDAQECNYKLDFRGLAGIPSTKNFIVENEQFQDALIFGRQDKEEYLMRIKAPLSLMQAFAISMSSIHYKFL